MEQFVQLILATQNPQLRQQAENQLNQLQATNISQLIISLLSVISNKTYPTNARQAAGLYFKNLFKTKGPNKADSEKRWNEIDENTRKLAHNALCSLLLEEDPNIRLLGANVIASIAFIDLTLERWPELMPFLLSDVSVAKLKAISFITEDIPFAPFASYIPAVENICLQVIATSLEHCTTSLAIFENLLYFSKLTSIPSERKKILDVICSALKHPHPEVKTKGFQAISTFAELYIEYFYEVAQVMLEVTTEILKIPINDDVIELQKTVLTLWRTVSSHERKFVERHPESPLKLIFTACNQLQNVIIPIIASVDDPNDDIDENDLSFIAQDTLYDISETIGAGYITAASPQILPLYSNPDWKIRFQAMSAFASMVINNGISEVLLNQHVKQIILLATDPTVLNRATAVYSICKCIKYYPLYFNEFLKLHAGNIFSMFKDCSVVKKAVSQFFSTICDPATGVNCKLFLDVNAVTTIIRTFLDESMKNPSLSECTTYLTAAGNVVRGCCSSEMASSIITFILSDCMSSQLFSTNDLVGYSVLFLDSCAFATQNTISGARGVSSLLSNKPLCDALFNVALKAFPMSPEPSLMLITSLCYMLEANFAAYCPILIPKTVEWFNSDLPNNIYKLLCELVGDISLTLQHDFEQYAANYMQLILNVFNKPYLTVYDRTGIVEVVGDIIASCPEQSKMAIPGIVSLLSGIIGVKASDDDEVINGVCDLRRAGLYVFSTIYQNYVIADIIPFVKITLQLIYVSVSDPYFPKMKPLVDYISNELYDIFMNKFAVQAPELISEVNNGTISKLIQNLKLGATNQETKKVLQTLASKLQGH